jgi:hypothetical protein
MLMPAAFALSACLNQYESLDQDCVDDAKDSYESIRSSAGYNGDVVDAVAGSEEDWVISQCMDTHSE